MSAPSYPAPNSLDSGLAHRHFPTLAGSEPFLRRAATGINRRAGVGVQRTYLYRASTADGWPAAAADENRIQWEMLAAEGILQLLNIVPFDVREYLQRLERGDGCYTLILDGRLAHYSWVQRSESHLITKAGLSVPVRNGEFWIYNSITAGWARGRGLYSAALERIVQEHFEAGYSTGWIYTSGENVASQRVISRVGFTPAATLRALRVGSHYFHLGQAPQGQ